MTHSDIEFDPKSLINNKDIVLDLTNINNFNDINKYKRSSLTPLSTDNSGGKSLIGLGSNIFKGESYGLNTPINFKSNYINNSKQSKNLSTEEPNSTKF